MAFTSFLSNLLAPYEEEKRQGLSKTKAAKNRRGEGVIAHRVNQEPCHIDVTMMNGEEERGVAIEVDGVDVCAIPNKGLGHVEVTLLRSVVKGREALHVTGAKVNVSTEETEESGTFTGIEDLPNYKYEESKKIKQRKKEKTKKNSNC